MKPLGKSARRWLLLGHRWLGIGTGLFLALWIGSGLVMLYVPFPSLGRAERLERLAPIAWDRVRIGPDAALAAAGGAGAPMAFGLEMRGAEPVYRLVAADGARATVSAATGLRLGSASAEEALRIAGGGDAQEFWRDQWTVTARYDPLRPFYRVTLSDAAGTEVTISAPTGEIALVTTRWERGWNWVGAVTHWVYLTPLRAAPETWRQVVLWLSGIASVTVVSGVIVGIWRLRVRRRYRTGAVTPYRGLALWHHAFGLLGGLGLTTFILSGWLSMNPNRWFSSLTPPESIRLAYAGNPGPLGLTPEDLRRLGGEGLKQVRLSPIGGRWWLVREDAAGPSILALDGEAGPDEALLTAAASVPGGRLTSVERLSAYDAYWYPKRVEAPLPVLRLVFDDPAATWLHIDPSDGTLLNRVDRSGRVNRWLFDAPHRLDLPGLTLRPTAREATQWVLNLLGVGIALTGLVAGARRLVRRPSRNLPGR